MKNCRVCRGPFDPPKAFYHTCGRCWAPRESQPKRLHTRLDSHEIKWLLQVAHPDRNPNSTIATEVTRKLLELRREAAA